MVGGSCARDPQVYLALQWGIGFGKLPVHALARVHLGYMTGSHPLMTFW